jgi:hypothetical protein
MDSTYYSKLELRGGVVMVSSKVPLVASYALLTMLHPLLKNILQTVDHFEICLRAPFLWRPGLYSRSSKGVPPIHSFQAKHRIQFGSYPMRFLGFSNNEKGASSEVRIFKVINGLQHVFEKWVESYKKCITCKRRYFERETITIPPQSSDLE